MALTDNFKDIIKRRFSVKTLIVLIATAAIISHFRLDVEIANLFPMFSPNGVFLEVFIIGTIFQMLKAVVELIFQNGFG